MSDLSFSYDLYVNCSKLKLCIPTKYHKDIYEVAKIKYTHGHRSCWKIQAFIITQVTKGWYLHNPPNLCTVITPRENKHNSLFQIRRQEEKHRSRLVIGVGPIQVQSYCPCMLRFLWQNALQNSSRSENSCHQFYNRICLKPPYFGRNTVAL